MLSFNVTIVLKKNDAIYELHEKRQNFFTRLTLSTVLIRNVCLRITRVKRNAKIHRSSANARRLVTQKIFSEERFFVEMLISAH